MGMARASEMLLPRRSIASKREFRSCTRARMVTRDIVTTMRVFEYRKNLTLSPSFMMQPFPVPCTAG